MWEKKAICKCGFVTSVPFGNRHHIHYSACPECGCDIDEWDIRTARIISAARWYNPFTWLTWKIEYKD